MISYDMGTLEASLILKKFYDSCSFVAITPGLVFFQKLKSFLLLPTITQVSSYCSLHVHQITKSHWRGSHDTIHVDLLSLIRHVREHREKAERSRATYRIQPNHHHLFVLPHAYGRFIRNDKRHGILFTLAYPNTTRLHCNPLPRHDRM